ncbi:DNA repair protein alkB, putative [Acanthamoeba castellanii str. Neff]|uniref:DNA repair protein alkB, putative n=1 Tax=Acanthamoeba castellanii (strain ATCC 30010 / Neff) TaxID=1257118 RepID=L8GGE8_ACACF|nr:DNA repair protein alkB, putative [Acanthamoeba castellanii str. Neff]ELR11271.1 DNA repair protein alkB, putative [Acanthamoeba castellanii str. Neff]
MSRNQRVQPGGGSRGGKPSGRGRGGAKPAVPGWAPVATTSTDSAPPLALAYTPSTSSSSSSGLRQAAALPPDLEYIEDFITADEERALVQAIDAQEWSEKLHRRTQHYGYEFDYSRQDINTSVPIELPVFAQQIIEKMRQRGLPQFDQLIINEYTPGQGINPHIDKTHCFGPCVVSLSLLSTCVMTFTSLETGEKIPVVLRPRSLVVLRGQARYGWQHGIEPKRADIVAGKHTPRARRVSLTYRTVAKSAGNA